MTSELSQHSLRHPRGRRRCHAGVLITLAAAALLPMTANAQTSGEPTESDDGSYVTTMTTPERSLDVTAFSPECVRDTPFVRYTIVPVGFVPADEHATLTVKDRNGNVVETREVTSFSGTFIYPGASVDSDGNPTDWPGWKRAEDGRWIPDVSDSFLREGLVIDVAVNPTATATVSYPAATSACNGPGKRAVEVAGFAPVCIAAAPLIEYSITTIGFTPTGPATLTFYDVEGRIVEQQVVTAMTGRVVYPGATVDATGTATDWPGWKHATNGKWIPDSSDAILREGLTVRVEVNPTATATATVSYPPATAPCNGPDDSPCVPGEDNDCTPCSPGQNNDDDPTDDCKLPKTGGGSGSLLYVGGAALLAGVGFLIASRRRNRPGATPTPG